MNRYVIDSSVAIKWFIYEDLQAEALAILNEWELGNLECVVPDWFYVEIGNILWKKHRNQLITREEVDTALAELGNLPLLIKPSHPLNDAAVSFAIKYDRTVYDSLYVVLAEEEDCPFVTADDRLANALAPHIPNIVKLADWKPSPPTALPPATTPTP